MSFSYFFRKPLALNIQGGAFIICCSTEKRFLPAWPNQPFPALQSLCSSLPSCLSPPLPACSLPAWAGSLGPYNRLLHACLKHHGKRHGNIPSSAMYPSRHRGSDPGFMDHAHPCLPGEKRLLPFSLFKCTGLAKPQDLGPGGNGQWREPALSPVCVGTAS